MSADKTYYVTTPIYYVNDAPHIGHAYTTVAGDVLTRWHRQRGEQVWFLTGTDEHGQKVLRTAEANGVGPQEWADRLVESAWKPVLSTIDAANDDFIRTTDARHTERVQRFLQSLFDKGEIYEADYEGPYCVGCEEFKLAGDLIDGTGEFEGQKCCPIHGTPVEMLSESNYFFGLSRYAQALLDHYEAHPDAVEPASARNEVLSFIRSGLSDLSISRSTFDWGIKVPWDESQVVYVWFDALLNYATAVGLGDTDEPGASMFARTFPADVHLVGKDILRFHAVIWPAMLMAAGLPLARQGVRARLVARRRREDEQEQAHGHRAERDHRPLRVGRLPLLLHARDHVRSGRVVLVGGHVGPLHRRAGQRFRQPGLARDGHDEQVLRRRAAGGHRRARRGA